MISAGADGIVLVIHETSWLLSSHLLHISWNTLVRLPWLWFLKTHELSWCMKPDQAWFFCTKSKNSQYFRKTQFKNRKNSVFQKFSNQVIMVPIFSIHIKIYSETIATSHPESDSWLLAIALAPDKLPSILFRCFCRVFGKLRSIFDFWKTQFNFWQNSVQSSKNSVPKMQKLSFSEMSKA